MRGKPADEEMKGISQPYQKARLNNTSQASLLEARTDVLARMVWEVMRQEGALHVSDLTKRLMDAFGVSRAGSRITAKIDEVLADCHRRSVAMLRGEFVYPTGDVSIQVRDRSNLESAERKIELVPPEELDLALVSCVRAAFSISEDEAVAASLSLLGFGRATQRIVSVMQARLDALLKSGAIRSEQGRLVAPE